MNANTKKNSNSNADIIVGYLNTASGLEESIGHAIVDLLREQKSDLVASGLAIGEAWKEGGLYKEAPIRPLAAGCLFAGLSKKEAGWLLNATGLVTRQRVSKLLGAIYEGKSQSTRAAKARVATLESVLRDIRTLALSKEDAAAIAKAVAARIVG